MKLRVAHIDDARRMGGKFVVQRRSFGTWDDMYFDPCEKKLQLEFTLGNAKVVKASFDDFHQAMKYARLYKQKDRKQIIREVWKV